MNIAIIGGGVIGLAVGWQLLRRDMQVTVFDANEAGSGASCVAAGMLAPYAEVGFEERELMRLGEESLRLYPGFLDELAEDTEEAPALDNCGTLIVGLDRDDTEHLKRLYDFREALEMDVKMISGSEAREREPLLSPRVVSALWLPGDAQIENDALIKSLKEAFRRRGGTLHEGLPVTGIEVTNARIRCLRTEAGRKRFDHVVLAAGCWSSMISGVPQNLLAPIRPVKGQIITLEQNDECRPECMVRSPRAYLVPKANGTLRLGASTEEKGFNTTATAGIQKVLLEEAFHIMPGIFDLPIHETVCGLRPASRDHGPVVGPTDLDGLYYATGHYRHGILMAPVTAYSIVNAVLGDPVTTALQRFSPSRFYSKYQAVQ